jgi:hypothetical protein
MSGHEARRRWRRVSHANVERSPTPRHRWRRVWPPGHPEVTTGVRVKRAYEPASPRDGYRVLVDRLWPWPFFYRRAGVDLRAAR